MLVFQIIPTEDFWNIYVLIHQKQVWNIKYCRMLRTSQEYKVELLNKTLLMLLKLVDNFII